MRKEDKSKEYALNERESQTLWGICSELKAGVLIGLLALCGLPESQAVYLKLETIRNE